MHSGEGRRVLVAQTGFLGDAILGTALVRQVMRSGVASQVGYLVRAPYGSLFRGSPEIDQLFEVEKRDRASVAKVVSEIRETGYDLLLAPHRSFSTAWMGYRSGIEQRVGFRIADGSFLYNEKVDYRTGIPEIVRNGSLLSAITGRPAPEAFPSLAHLVESASKVHRSGIAIAYGSVWRTKQWGGERYSRLVRALLDDGEDVFLIGSQEERREGLLIAEQSGLKRERVVAGEFTLPGLARFLSERELTISNDSGGLHLSEASGTPVVAIFGPTVIPFGFSPWMADSRVVERTDLACRPCGIHGGNSCPLRHHACMSGLSVEQVLKAVRSSRLESIR